MLLPCRGIRYGETRSIAENICSGIHERTAKISTINTSNHSRGGKVYIDASQNDYGDRLVAPYCINSLTSQHLWTGTK